ncbi:YbaK/EbsC family protein [Halovenus halobia]|uniref:YbaK/EbsC family protein n=1 Tax=Halovenus halobia TaxID=3396622 RepID=UPI003F55EABA
MDETDPHQRFLTHAREEHDFEVDPQRFPDGTETAGDAARALGCDEAQIASSIVLVADELLVVITSGANTVDTRTLATLRGVHTARMADPDEVHETLGYEVGGVPPFGHDTTVPVYFDADLRAFDTVWAAAGSPETVFPISPDQLIEYTDAIVADLAE